MRAAVLTLLLWIPSIENAQQLSPDTLLKPATNNWPTYNGDYSGRRFSSLDQINVSNVGDIVDGLGLSRHEIWSGRFRIGD